VPYADPWKQGGTGLGLALVKKLVHQINGAIAVESVDGWTMFNVNVPIELDESLTTS
jgi:nitrogen-specific signal transduction histidine kinase